MRARCECGAAKPPGAEACERCLVLDGKTVGEARVIDALRLLGGRATTVALAFETGVSLQRLRRLIRRLERAGRIAMMVDEDDDGRRTYFLDGRARV